MAERGGEAAAELGPGWQQRGLGRSFVKGVALAVLEIGRAVAAAGRGGSGGGLL